MQVFSIQELQTLELEETSECKEVLSINERYQHFTIINNNIGSVNKNLDELKIILDSMRTSIGCRIIAGTGQLQKQSLFHIPGFNLVYKEGNFNQNEGVLVYVKENYFIN